MIRKFGLENLYLPTFQGIGEAAVLIREQVLDPTTLIVGHHLGLRKHQIRELRVSSLPLAGS